MPLQRFSIPIGLLMLMLLLPACNEAPAGRATAEGLPHSHLFPLRVGDRTIHAQIALTNDEMARGLMERQAMPPDEGMIFVYQRPIRASFWMKNTPLPLDIGFFNSRGTLLEIYRLHPHDLSTVRSRNDDVQFALEMNQGWFSLHRIRPGASLDLELLRQALDARGFNPGDYGL
jgi:uncharacterized protein